MKLPKTAEEFIRFMEAIWSMESRPVSGGGVVLQGCDNILYDQFHHARHTVRLAGAIRTGGTHINFDGDKIPADVFRFPGDHPWTSVIISRDGGMARINHRKPHTPRGPA